MKSAIQKSTYQRQHTYRAVRNAKHQLGYPHGVPRPCCLLLLQYNSLFLRDMVKPLPRKGVYVWEDDRSNLALPKG